MIMGATTVQSAKNENRTISMIALLMTVMTMIHMLLLIMIRIFRRWKIKS